MSDPGAYEDEMRRLFGSDDELDRLFDGTAADDRTRDIAFLLADVKDAAMTPLSSTKAAEHVAAISAEATRLAPTPVRVDVVADLPLWRRFVDKNAPRVAKAAAGVVAASMSLMGMAHAGVDLPGQAAAQAFESVTGVELPNQDGDENATPSDVAVAVQAVIESYGDERGCEFGQAVAAAASQGRSLQDENAEACTQDEVAEGETEGEPEGSRATGEEASAEGRAKAAEKSGGASEAGAGNATTGAENAETGKATATEKSGGASDAGAGNAGGGDDSEASEVEEEDEGAQGGRETGEEAANEGQSNAPVEVPGP